MSPTVNLPPILYGGTGFDSANQNMPDSLPEKYEMGTLNIAGVAGLNASLSPAMYADIGDYYENKTGYRMHSYLLSFFSLNFSVAQLFTGSIISICLGIVGFDKGAAITPEMLTMFRNMVSLIPGIPLALGAVASLFYPLSEKKMEQVHAELTAKQSAE